MIVSKAILFLTVHWFRLKGEFDKTKIVDTAYVTINRVSFFVDVALLLCIASISGEWMLTALYIAFISVIRFGVAEHFWTVEQCVSTTELFLLFSIAIAENISFLLGVVAAFIISIYFRKDIPAI